MMCFDVSLSLSLPLFPRYKTNSRWVGTWVDWMYIYAMITVLNLILAIIGCYLVERPFMHLSKKFTFEDIHI